MAGTAGTLVEMEEKDWRILYKEGLISLQKLKEKTKKKKEA